MKLTLIQTDILWLQPHLNMQRAEAMIADAEKSDVYILPEMFTTGFAVHPEERLFRTCSLSARPRTMRLLSPG